MEFNISEYIKQLAPSSGNYKVCSRCVMDTSAADIEFDDKGVCNFCQGFEDRLKKTEFPGDAEIKTQKDKLIRSIKEAGKGKRYDCIVGVSGGADSSWALFQVVKSGLRPLAVHMDNGWDREIAANNIENLVCKLRVDLYTYVIDWEEYRALMQAFFDADVIDVELLYDNAMLAVNYNQALKNNVGYILAGTNLSTEGMEIPKNWNCFKWDKKNIYAINRKFGHGRKIKTFPAIGFAKWFYALYLQRIKWVSFLDYLEYDKAKCMEILEKEMGFKPYPYKHYESIFTRFYQGYILPVKFGIDKRKVHLSSLIISKQITRDEALKILEEIPYPTGDVLKDDIEYFIKKMNWQDQDLADYLSRPEIPHAQYGSEEYKWKFCSKLNSFRKKYK